MVQGMESPYKSRAREAGASGAVSAIYTEGDALYEAMLADIVAARHQIALESYIFADDEIGARFTDALLAAARAGRDVRVLIDAVGSRNLATPTMVSQLRRGGIEVRWFHPWSWRHPARYMKRDHRKLLVTDGAHAYLGGFNIHRDSSRRIVGSRRWRDTHVRVEGQLADDAAQTFDLMWDPARGLHEGDGADAGTFLISTDGRVTRRELRTLLVQAFDSARRHILLTTPYFVPDRFVQRALRRAAKRGVAIHVLVPAMSDVPMAQWAARAVYGNLLSEGIRIHEYLPRILHAKTTVVDGCWATVGTANMDYWSLLSNYELNLVSAEMDLIARLEADFHNDLAQSRHIETKMWDARSVGDRAVELIGWLARHWL